MPDQDEGSGNADRHQTGNDGDMRTLYTLSALVFALTGSGYVGGAQAAQLPLDQFTRQAPADTAHLSADLNGDGQKDDIWFSHNGADRLNLHVRFGGAPFGEDQVVTGLDAAQAHQLLNAPAGTYRLDCGDYASDCGQGLVRTDHDSLMLSLDEGLNVLIYWDGKGFTQDFVASTELRLRRAMAVRFALNL